MAAGLAGLTAALITLLSTAVDFAATTVAAPPPPAPPEGVSPEEWERVLTSPSPGPDGDPLTNLELFGRLVEVGLVVLAVAGIVLWLVVAVGAARGLGWSRFVAVVVAAVQAMTLPVVAVGSSPGVLVVAGAVIVAGGTSAALLFRPEPLAGSRRAV